MTIEDLDSKIDKKFERVYEKQDKTIETINDLKITNENHEGRIKTLETAVHEIKSDKKDFRKTWIAPIAISLIIGATWFLIGTLNFIQIKQHQGTSVTQNVKP